MKKIIIFCLLSASLGACVETTSDEEFLRKIYALGPNSPQTEVIYRRYPAISPSKVTVMFGYPSDCKNAKDVGVLIGWGKSGQSQQEIIRDFQVRAAKYGANMVAYEAGASSAAQVGEILHTRSGYTMMRCG